MILVPLVLCVAIVKRPFKESTANGRMAHMATESTPILYWFGRGVPEGWAKMDWLIKRPIIRAKKRSCFCMVEYKFKVVKQGSVLWVFV